jgi:hypothetical protein
MAQAPGFRRRQNRSCDQCRTGKRRCDVQLGLQHLEAAECFDFSQNEVQDPPDLCVLSPCSNCKKWKKRCTIDWVRSHQPHPSTNSGRPRRAKGPNRTQDRPIPILGDTYVDWHALPTSGDVDGRCEDDQIKSAYNVPSHHGAYPGVVPDASFFTGAPGSAQYMSSAEASRNFQPHYNFAPPRFADPVMGETVDDQMMDQDISLASQASSTYDLESLALSRDTMSSPRSRKTNSESDLTLDTSSYPYPPLAKRLRRQETSPFASQFLAENHNRLYIKKGLLKIYHDSLEGALSCWLIERNCPYASTPSMDDADTWSSNWSNRIIARVRTLDESYSKLGLISPNEQKQASAVLSTVVMAFAVQWAQTAFQKHEDLRSQLPEHGLFGRNMQKQLWHKANTALSQATSNPSFKVIFAGIVFSLVQQPMDSAEILPNSDTKPQNDLAALRKILEVDGGPIFLDVAVRKLHDHQRKLKDADNHRALRPLDVQTQQVLGERDRQTFGLVFWLAIMFDTLSAAMNRRAFVLTDGDTKIDNEKEPANFDGTMDVEDLTCDLDGFSTVPGSNDNRSTEDSQIWGDYFLRQQSRIGDYRKHSTRWPCSYLDAASCLADAAPVKVLAYRRLGHLQDLYYQRASPDAIEKAISSTLEVYNHWKGTYGLFISDCVANHENLPARIQSWYILLASHWNLAILLLADLVEKMDDLGVTREADRATRQATEFTAMLRTRCVCIMSDLGRCSRSSEELSFSQSPDFHHAVNKAALLTEPWTVVLVRSFAYAGEVLAKVILSDQRTGLLADTITLTDARTRLNDCIEALWLLSRKSDMALSAAKILQEAVYQAPV